MWLNWWLVGLVAAECDIDQAAYLQTAQVKAQFPDIAPFNDVLESNDQVGSLMPSHEGHKEALTKDAFVASEPLKTENPAPGNVSETSNPTPVKPLAAEHPAPGNVSEATNPTPLKPLAAENPAPGNASKVAFAASTPVAGNASKATNPTPSKSLEPSAARNASEATSQTPSESLEPSAAESPAARNPSEATRQTPPESLWPSAAESPAARNPSEATSQTPSESLWPSAAESPAARNPSEATSQTPSESLEPSAAESPAARNPSEATNVSSLAGHSNTVTGGVDGDPHVQTLDGKHYTLLREGTFSLWHFSGYNSTFFSPEIMENRSVEVDWQIYVHYAGGHSFAKGLLVVDQTVSPTPRVTLEFTAEKCRWRQKIHEDWSPIVKATDVFVPDGADYVTGFKFTENPHNKGMKDIHFRMNSNNGILRVATLKVACHPGSHINTRLLMHNASLSHFVEGQLAPTAAKRPRKDSMSTLQSEDEEYLVESKWMQLGGSQNAARYLKEVDLGSSELNLLSCDQGQEQHARRLCRKHLGPSRERARRNTWRRNIFEDCVFDICAGAGEATAEMAQEIEMA